MTAIKIAEATQTGTGGFTLAMPTGTLARDVVLAFINTNGETFTMPAAFTEAGDSPQLGLVGPAVGATRLAVAYRRYEDGDAGFVMPDSGNLNQVRLETWRGVIETGNPFDVTSGGTDTTSDTSLDATGATTTTADCVVVIAVSNGTDGLTTDQASGWTNSDLTGLASSGFIQSATANGGGISTASGVKTTAGTYGTTTATMANATRKGWWTGALKPAVGPWFRAVGAISGSGVGNNYAWPAGTYQSGDLGLLVIETANETVTETSGGWTELTNSPQGTGTGGAAGATRITVFWKRATSTTETDAATNDPGDHNDAGIFVFRNAQIDTTSGGTKASASTSTSITGVTTSTNNELVVYATTRDNDSAGANWASWADASLSNFGEIADAGTTAGNGGGIGVAAGFLATAGASGTATATSTASTVEGFMCIALKLYSATTGSRFFASIVG